MKRSLTDVQAGFRQRLPRAILLLCVVVFLECWLVSMIFQVRYDSRNREYIIVTLTDNEFQTDTPVALMSFLNSVSALEQYSDSTRLIRLGDNKDTVLAGAAGLDRRAVRMQVFQEEAANTSAGQLRTLAENLVIGDGTSREDYWALVRITEAETTESDIMSKMMVAGVVLNRVNDDRFPDTVYDVVFQSGQFSPVGDGRYYSSSITDDTIEAIERVLDGEDYTEGALFFVAQDSADASRAEWFETELTWLFSYGGHDFYTY